MQVQRAKSESGLWLTVVSRVKGLPHSRVVSANQAKFIWRIENFSLLTERVYYSDVFTIGGCKWRLLVYPKGNNTGHLSIFLDVADAATLPNGWSRDAKFSFLMVNQNTERRPSTRRDAVHTFNAPEPCYGFLTFKPLKDLTNPRNGFLVNDTLIVEANVDVRGAVPPIEVPVADLLSSNVVPLEITETNRFKDWSTSNCSKNDGNVNLICAPPSLEEVEKAKQSIKEWLSDLFRLNTTDRLSAALSTLARAKVGLSPVQKESIEAFWPNFDDFVSDFLTFGRDSAEFDLQRLGRDQTLSDLRKQHETHLSNKQLLESLLAEEEELKKKMEEIEARKVKLKSDLESLMTESEEAYSRYEVQGKKLAEAEEKKKIAEKRMSRSTAAWSSLKAHFS